MPNTTATAGINEEPEGPEHTKKNQRNEEAIGPPASSGTQRQPIIGEHDRDRHDDEPNDNELGRLLQRRRQPEPGEPHRRHHNEEDPRGHAEPDCDHHTTEHKRPIGNRADLKEQLPSGALSRPSRSRAATL